MELIDLAGPFTSLRWRRRFFEPGEFELHCQYNLNSLELFAKSNIIHRLDRAEAGIIEGVVAEGTQSGDMIAVTGRFFSSILDTRSVVNTFNFEGTVEQAMRKVVSDNCIASRPINLLKLGTLNGFSQTCSFQTTGKQVSDVIQALSISSDIGNRVRIDAAGKSWIFETYQGVDRSVTQTEHPYVLFSQENANILSPKYTQNNRNFRNYAYVAGEGTGSGRIIVTVDRIKGGTRRELYVDARDLQQESLSNTEYRNRLTQRGLEKLAEAAEIENFEASAINTGSHIYLDDWDLGDTVSFKKWGITSNQIITEVEEVYENGITTIIPTCGSPLPESLNLGGI